MNEETTLSNAAASFNCSLESPKVTFSPAASVINDVSLRLRVTQAANKKKAAVKQMFADFDPSKWEMLE